MKLYDITVYKESIDHHIPDKSEILIETKGIETLLLKLNPHKAFVPDNKKPLLLKSLAEELSPILTNTFQKSIDSGTVSSQWKGVCKCNFNIQIRG